MVRVFMNEPKLFTVLIQSPGSTQLKLIQFFSSNVEFQTDVSTNDSMWVEGESLPIYSSSNVIHMKKMTIHLHSAHNLEGSGWNHGKSGKGQTQVIK